MRSARGLVLLSLLVAGAAVGAGLLLPACGSFKPQAQPDGSYRLLCSSTFAQCKQRARQYCDEEELHLIETTKDAVFGVQGHETGTEGAEVHFRCGSGPAPTEWKLPARRPRRAPVASAAPPPPARVCVPGATQRCVGPGACAGGQACLPDGSGFGPCDCGPQASGSSEAAGGAPPAP